MARLRSAARLALIRQQPCLVCLRPGVQAHHLMFAERSAMGLRSGDDFAVPLCAEHHRQLHRVGDERRWWALQGVDPIEWLERFRHG